MFISRLRIALAVAFAVSTISCGRPISSNPSTYVGRYQLMNPDPDGSDLPPGVELRSDMTVVEFFGYERAVAPKVVGRWYVNARAEDDVNIVFAGFFHAVGIERGEIRLYLNFDLDEYFGKPAR